MGLQRRQVLGRRVALVGGETVQRMGFVEGLAQAGTLSAAVVGELVDGTAGFIEAAS